MSATTPPMPPASGDGDDTALATRFAALEPRPAAIVRMGAAVEARLARLARPLWREWLALVTARPLAAPLLAAAAFAFVIFTTPAGVAVGLVARALAGGAALATASASTHAAATRAPSAHRAESHAHHHAVAREGDRRR